MEEEVDPDISIKEYNERRDTSCQLAAHLFLYPEFVIKTSLYWLSQYSSYINKKKEDDFFNDIIYGILQHRPQLKIYANEGMEHDDSHSLSYRSTIHFMGGESLYVPMTYYDETGVDKNDNTLFSTLKLLVQTKKKCYMQRTSMGVTGELELGHYIHDSILLHFYEPFLYILTLYKSHLSALIGLSGGQQLVDWLPRHKYSLRAINEDSLGKITCFSSSPDEAVRLSRLKEELRELYDVLNTSDLEKAREKIGALWTKKATQCYEEEPYVRYHALISGMK